MLIPRFSIRWVLLLTVVVALLLLIVRQAFLEEQWAMAVTAGMVLLLGTFLIYAVVFGLVYSVAWASRTLGPRPTSQNPFVVEGQYPPQDVPKNPYGDNL